jgi:hypothetical protein
MKTWIARRLIIWAIWLDVEEVVYASIDIFRALLDVVEKGEDDA